MPAAAADTPPQAGTEKQKETHFLTNLNGCPLISLNIILQQQTLINYYNFQEMIMEIKIDELEAREEMFDFDMAVNGVKLC